MHGLNTPLKEILGGKTATAFSKNFDINTVEDLLRHFPRRYSTRGELTEISSLQPDEHVTIMAEVLSVTRRSMRQRKGSLLEAVVTDGRESIKLTFFNQDWRERELKVGRRGLFSGKVSVFNNTRQLAQPVYMLIPGDEEPDEEAVAAFARPLIPVYPASSSLASWVIERSVNLVLDGLDPLVKETLPTEVMAAYSFPHVVQAFTFIHQPQTMTEVHQAREKFAFEEAFVYQTVLAMRRRDAESALATARIASANGLLRRFDSALPFQLTDGQIAVGDEITQDLAQSHPMHRLLQGEVGSGKTLCALRAMLTVVDAGGQAVLLAPTEVLAQQHARSIKHMLGALHSEEGLFDSSDGPRTKVTLLTGSATAAQRRTALLDASSGAAGIVVGTHALLEDRVQFADLGLVVVDEQHRFGVEQRARLSEKAVKGQRPHVLVMTATPIPRTVAMTIFGDLDVSVLSELPRGRSKIATHVVSTTAQPALVERTWKRVQEEVSKGHQVYVVCPRISTTASDEEVSDGNNLATVEDVAAQLQTGPLFGLRIAQLHGRLPSDEKESIMQKFNQGEIDVLVSTTVIEVGVDVPNASTMVIMDADRFGVSQLHQLRGRVGRGSVAGLCLLLSSVDMESSSWQRLQSVAATLDGFELSRIDLEQRREGDVLGAMQSGRRSSLKVLNVLRDEETISQARQAAQEVILHNPHLEGLPQLTMRINAILQQERSEYLEKA